MEAALDRFRAADTQVLGVSIDSVYSHANWARDLGGISFPLLSDFEPKGAVARSLGHYLAEAGITDRATVVIDKEGIVRYSVSVTPSGKRDVDELVRICEGVQAEQKGAAGGMPAPGRMPAGTTLYVKSHCGASRKALLAIENLHSQDAVTIRNVTGDSSAAAELEKLGGKVQAPCLVLDGKPIYESDDIVKKLADLVAPC